MLAVILDKAAPFLKPSRIERVLGGMLARPIRIGVIRGHFHVLEVRGRKTGRTVSIPVDPLDVEGRRYLVCPRGEAGWVRNARVAGEVVLVRGRAPPVVRRP